MARYKLDQWKSFIAEWQKSGKTREEYCREQDLTVATFSYWRTKINKLKNTETEVPSRDAFVRYSLPSPTSNGITIEWPDGMKLRLSSGIKLHEIAELVSALKGHR